MSCATSSCSTLVGNTLRFDVEITSLGHHVDPTTLTLTLHPPSAVDVVYSSPVRAKKGIYYLDINFPTSAEIGLWKFRWTASGNGAGVSEGTFQLAGLSF